MGDPVKRRGYVSPLRAERARRSRSRIVAAAIRLFLADGYARTTIAAVAAAAGVSADRVFHLFGSKRELLRAAMDASVGGDDRDVPFLERAEPQAMRRETDQRRQIAMFAAGMAGQLERGGRSMTCCATRRRSTRRLPRSARTSSSASGARR